MSLLFPMKALRFLLAASVSIWMAGGCLFGCSNTAMAASHEAGDSAQTVVAGESCHSAPSHDCCASLKPKKKSVAGHSNQPKGLLSFAPTPRGMMNDCPLVVNATAATSKNSGYLSDSGRGPISSEPLIENQTERPDTSAVVRIPPSRGPTYLRCCVFLI